jgi:drug/metabolite transporter (DMT)-like permease
VGTVLLSAALPFLADIPAYVSWRDVFFLVLLGFFAGIGHWMFISAFLMAPASLLAPFTYVHMIWATLYGYLIFGQLPDGLSALGMAVIVASGVGLVVHERIRGRG